MPRKKKLEIAVLDTETDPFKFGRIPKPFALEFHSENITQAFWGDNCVNEFADWAEALDQPFMIYAHNGGKFDFHFMHRFLDNPIKVIKSRIVSASFFQHTLRDSYAILPVPLRDYEKDEFNYALMERHTREKHKAKILEYLHNDCASLYSLVTKFVDQFGVRLTIGGTAMREIKKRYEFETMDEATDKVFRRFYYGGRVQCFESGILPGPWQHVDVNSEYPFVMKTYKHPVNGTFEICDKRPRGFKKPYFLHFIGRNDNALPCKENGELIFTKEHGEFFACSHELEIALEHGLVEIDKVLNCYVASETITFDDYVNDFSNQKIAAEMAGDKAGRLFAKLLLNSGYGKFGQNPENFCDYLIARENEHDPDRLEEMGYALDTEFDEFDLWSRPSRVIDSGLYDVSIAASITSAARACLLLGLQQADRPIYCDTDSIICRSFKGRQHPTELGAWKLEATAPTALIAGKKMYALCDGFKTTTARQRRLGAPKNPVKLVSKGGTLTLADMVRICKGGSVEYHNQAPTFSLKKAASHDPAKMFVSRKFTMTANKRANVDVDDL